MRRNSHRRACLGRSTLGEAPSRTSVTGWHTGPKDTRQTAVMAARSTGPLAAQAARASSMRDATGIRPRSSGRTSRSAAAATPVSRWSALVTASCGHSSSGPTRRSPNVMSTTARPLSVNTAQPVWRKRRGSSACSMRAADRAFSMAARTPATSLSWHQMSRSLASVADSQSATASVGPCHAQT